MTLAQIARFRRDKLSQPPPSRACGYFHPIFDFEDSVHLYAYVSMVDNEESYMFLDDIIVKNLGVMKIAPHTRNVVTYPSIDLSQDRTLGVMFTDAMSGNVTSYVTLGPSNDGHLIIGTKELGVQLSTNGNVFYEVSSTVDGKPICHGTSASGHAFTNTGSLGRLEISNCSGSVISAKTPCDSLGELILSAATVEIPQADFVVTDKVSVSRDTGVQLGNGQCPIALQGPTSIIGNAAIQGNLSVNTNVIIAGDLVVAGNIVTSSRIGSDCPNSTYVLNADTINADDLSANILVVNDSTTLNVVSANRMATQTLNVLGPTTLDTVSCGGDTTIQGNLFCANFISSESANVQGAHFNTVSAAHVGIGCEADSSNGLTVQGNAQVTGSMSISNATVGSLGDDGVTLKAFGDANFTDNVKIDGCLMTSSIEPQGGSLSMTANALYFNADQIYFKSNAYVIDSDTTTYAYNVLKLGNVQSTDSIRNGSGLQILGVPDNAPSASNLSTSLTWSACSGLFDPSGNVVPAATRSKWVLDGGNFSMNSVDQKFNYMFSIDDGELNIWKTTVLNGSSTDTQKVATFGRTRIV